MNDEDPNETDREGAPLPDPGASARQESRSGKHTERGKTKRVRQEWKVGKTRRGGRRAGKRVRQKAGRMSLANAAKAFERARETQKRKARRKIECKRSTRSWAKEAEVRQVTAKENELTRVEKDLAEVIAAQRLEQMS